jgi:hypothetical protein
MADYRFDPPSFPPLVVHLSDFERGKCCEIGQRRHMMHVMQGREDPKVDPLMPGVVMHGLGCIGEYAVAKTFGLRWDGQFFDEATWQWWRRNGHDVSGLEVRNTTHTTGRLTVHEPERDKPNAFYVLVRSHRKPFYEIVGWYLGAYAQARPDWWEAPGGHGRPAFYVPNSVLWDPRYLPSYLPRMAA